MSMQEFNFADYAHDFDQHIGHSIPGYNQLVKRTAAHSRWFVRRGTKVIDLGCTTGTVLAAVRAANQFDRPSVQYVGIDIEPAFSQAWDRHNASNLRFRRADIRTCRGIANASLIASLFTIQFLPPVDKRAMLKRIFDGLVEGGALIIAEKTLAHSARLQEMAIFDYYDQKRENGFSPGEILDKERGLRGKMTLWTDEELVAALHEARFVDLQRFWVNGLFEAFVALKPSG